MTDTIEAVALEKLRADLKEATKQHMTVMVVTSDYLRSVLDTIAALKAEIERLTEREAQAKLDGVRAGIDAAKRALNTAKGVNKAALWDVNHILGTLSAEAIAKGEA